MKNFVCLAILFFGINLTVCLAQKSESIKPIQTWNGEKIDNKFLKRDPKNEFLSKGFINDANHWAQTWQAWRKGELPEIDFTKNLIVFCTTITPNHCSIELKLSSAGDLQIKSLTTLIGSSDKTFNYKIVLINRAGIKSVERKSIAPKKSRRVKK